MKVSAKLPGGDPEEDIGLTEKARAQLDHEEHSQVLEHRDKFSEFAYGITRAWVGFLIVLTCSQFGLVRFGYGLSQAEFITVFSTTTAAVFGFAVLVGNFLFPRGGSSKQRSR